MDAPLGSSIAEPQSQEPSTQDVDTPMQDAEPQLPTEDNSSSDSSDSEKEEETPQVEWLATSRQKRSTAGNRLHALLLQAEGEEDPEDELALLFNEDDAGEDHGFEDAGNDSDVQMDSSSDDEDAAVDDDMEGEKVLQKQEKAEKQTKKKRLHEKVPFVKKRVKIDPTISQAPAPRPKKKSERASWIPTADELPTRASARGTTRQSKEQLHVQMVDREIKRIKQLKNMEKAAAAKKAKEKPALTQADRLAEAARIEKANSKSLSRWEESEMLREEEQKAKLAALKNRHLDGPIITWWSGTAEYIGGRLAQVGKDLIIEEPKEKPVTKKRKASEMGEEGEKEKTSIEAILPAVTEGTKEESIKNGTPTEVTPTETPAEVDSPVLLESKQPPTTGTQPSQPGPSIPKPYTPPPQMQEYQPLPPIQPQVHLPPRSSVLAPPPGLPIQAPHPPPNFNHAYPHMPPYMLAPPVLDGSVPVPGLGYGYNFQQSLPPFFSQTHLYPQPSPNTFSMPKLPTPPPPLPPPELAPAPPTITHYTANYLILQNFSETLIKDKSIQTEIIFGRKFQKIPASRGNKSNHAICSITQTPAKYKDPTTGLPYANGFAYKQIQNCKRGEYLWSPLVGAYVGLGTKVVARGVPERFKDGNGVRETEIMKVEEVVMGEKIGVGVVEEKQEQIVEIEKQVGKEVEKKVWKEGISLGRALREGLGGNGNGNDNGFAGFQDMMSAKKT